MSRSSLLGAGPARRSVAMAALVTLGLVSAACTSSPPATTTGADASCSAVSGTHHARVVVEVSATKIVSSCVGFSTPTISAVKVLDDSHIPLRTENYSSLGLAICSADGVPAHYSQCFSSSGSYWALFTSRDGAAWQMPAVGVSQVTVHPGDSIGLRYDSETGTSAPPPTPRPA